jgi:hypothetical protein
MAERNLREISDEEEIWLTIRSVLTVTRVAVLFGTILVSEFFEEYYFLDLTVAIWSLIVGIPLSTRANDDHSSTYTGTNLKSDSSHITGLNRPLACIDTLVFQQLIVLSTFNDRSIDHS